MNALNTRILVATVALLVTRDAMTTLPVTVALHELPIQQAVFGEDSVVVREDQVTAPVVISPGDEAARLEGRYGPEALEKAYGANYKGQIRKAAIEAKVGDAPDVVDVGLGGFDGTGESVTVEPSSFAEMTKAQLLEHAKATGIEGAKKEMSKAEILAVIEQAEAVPA